MRGFLFSGSALALVLAPSLVHAGAWTMPENAGHVLVTSTASQANKGYDDWSNTRARPRYGKMELQALIEYGVTDWLTAIVMPGLQHISIAPPVAARRSGLGISEFGGRARLFAGDAPGGLSWVISGQATLRVPGTFDSSNPAAIGYTDFETDLRALFGAGFALGAWPAFIDVQLGQRFRAGGPPNESRVDLTFGVRPSPEWLVLTQSFSVISHGAGDAMFPAYHYHKLQLSVVYSIDANWSLQGGVFTTYGGRNALQENGVLFGAGYRFSAGSAR